MRASSAEISSRTHARPSSSSRFTSASIASRRAVRQVFVSDALLNPMIHSFFSNSIFEQLWNRQSVDHIQITVGEKLGDAFGDSPRVERFGFARERVEGTREGGLRKGGTLGEQLARGMRHRVAIGQLPSMTAWYAFPGENGLKITDVIKDHLQSVVNGSAKPADALKKMTSDTQALLPK